MNDEEEKKDEAPAPKKKRGFACLSPARRAEIASMGGHAAHACGNAHRFTSQEAIIAGRKGGLKGGGGRKKKKPEPEETPPTGEE